MNILIVDSNYVFLSTCETTVYLYDEEDINIIKAQNLSNIDKIIREQKPDKIAINAMFIESLTNFDIDVPYAVYARTQADDYILSESSMPSYGYVSSAEELLNYIIQDQVKNRQSLSKPKTPQNPQKQHKEHISNAVTQKRPQQKVQRPQQPQKTKVELHRENASNNNERRPQKPQTERHKETNVSNTRKEYYKEPDIPESDEFIDEDNELIDESEILNSESYDESEEYVEEDYSEEESYGEEAETDALDFDDEPEEIYEKPEPHKAQHKNATEQERLTTATHHNNQQKSAPQKPSSNRTNDFQARAREAKKQAEEQKKSALATSRTSRTNIEAEKQVNKDMGLVKTPAKVVTVYSSKGGVGKTTIACELATFLALTASGRGRLKVCLVDCNIDFGDVLNTLDFDVNGPCMMDWYSDIEVKAEDGIEPNDISYTEDEIARFLQKKETDGLYALLAPMTNEDSMELEGTHIEIMLRNLIQNGGFDFIIIDTGNNTRDSSFIALQMADIILMVLTQSTNTANCNASFLNAVEAMNRFGDEALDLNKIKLVINQIRPANSVGISVQELEDAFENPVTGRPYETYARIKDSNDVRKASNNAEPLVYKSAAEFTRSIASLASTLIGESHVLDAPKKKKGFFSLFKK